MNNTTETNDMMIRYQSCFESIEQRTIVCNCPIHRGDTMVQVVAKSRSGKTLVVMEDKYGIHGTVGCFESLDDAPAPLVTMVELELMICEAIQ